MTPEIRAILKLRAECVEKIHACLAHKDKKEIIEIITSWMPTDDVKHVAEFLWVRKEVY